MSPTSYQTAPPRMLMITNAVGAVKRLASEILLLFSPPCSLGAHAKFPDVPVACCAQ
jgi:hypothetical protein